MNELKACGVLVVRCDPANPRSVRDVLLMQHADRWDLPKGHTEPGEKDIDCALRELQEETGLTADDVELDPQFRWTIQYPVVSTRTGGDTRLKTVVIFLGRLRRERDITCTEHAGFRWFPWPVGKIQERTIDPLLSHLSDFLAPR